MDNADHRPTPAQLFADAVWAAGEDDLTTLEALVLLAYVKHTRRGADRAWVSQRRLMHLCKLGGPASVVRVRASLVKKGWLDPVDIASVRGGRTTVYRLAIPAGASASGSLSESLDGGSGSMSEPLPSESGSLSEPGTESDSLSEPLRSPLENESGSLSESVGETKRFTVHSKAVHSETESGSLSEQEVLESAPPIGGEQVGRERAAHTHAREGAALRAPSLKHSSKNGNGAMSRAEAIAAMRSMLPKGKPLSRYPKPDADEGGKP